MSITTYEGPMFGTPEWWSYWKRQPKDEIIRFYEVAVNAYKEKDKEALDLRDALNKEHIAWQCADCKSDSLEIENEKLQKMVDWLVAMLGKEYPNYSKEELLNLARKASQNEA